MHYVHGVRAIESPLYGDDIGLVLISEIALSQKQRYPLGVASFVAIFKKDTWDAPH
jgi:hypothetical protein